MKKQQLIQGQDYHGWAWQYLGDCNGDLTHGAIFHWAEPHRPSSRSKPTNKGRWIRVKFVAIQEERK